MCYLYCAVGGTVDVATLSQIIIKRIRDLKTTPEELKDAFQVFDKQGTGMISVHDLKLSLTTLGERLADEELDELIREVDQDGEGMVNYQGAHYLLNNGDGECRFLAAYKRSMTQVGRLGPKVGSIHCMNQVNLLQ